MAPARVALFLIGAEVGLVLLTVFLLLVVCTGTRICSNVAFVMDVVAGMVDGTG